MTQIAEAYFHVKEFNPSEVDLLTLGDAAALIAAQTALPIFDPSAIIDVRLAEGSVKGWIKVATVLTIYSSVADYKGFKESIVEIVHDSKRFSGLFIEKLSQSGQIKKGYMYRVERRTKTPGRIKKIIEKQEWLERHKSALRTSQIYQIEIEIEKMLQLVLLDLDPSDRAAIRKVLGREVPRLPIPEESRHIIGTRQSDLSGVLFDLSPEEPAGLADYHARFRLRDGPSLNSGIESVREAFQRPKDPPAIGQLRSDNLSSNDRQHPLTVPRGGKFGLIPD